PLIAYPSEGLSAYLAILLAQNPPTFTPSITHNNTPYTYHNKYIMSTPTSSVSSLGALHAATKISGTRVRLYEAKLSRARHRLAVFAITTGYAHWAAAPLSANWAAKSSVESFFDWKNLCAVIRVQEWIVDWETALILEKENGRMLRERSVGLNGTQDVGRQDETGRRQ
ncbi:hypothetical protein P280DRAFT_535012, partial [Massarina eburnea CBS 473.64]